MGVHEPTPTILVVPTAEKRGDALCCGVELDDDLDVRRSAYQHPQQLRGLLEVDQSIVVAFLVEVEASELHESAGIRIEEPWVEVGPWLALEQLQAVHQQQA